MTRDAQRFQPLRGRVLNAQALAEVQQQLAHLPQQRDLLLEYLHCLNDAQGSLRLDQLHALAAWLNIPAVEVLETAAFYAHFQIIETDATPPPKLKIRVCESLSCQLAGAEALYQGLQQGLDLSQVQLLKAPCVGRCAEAPVAIVGQFPVAKASVQSVVQHWQAGDCQPEHLSWPSCETYQQQGGYAVLKRVRTGALGLDQVIDQLNHAGLRGLGGAGFPTARKWKLVAEQPGPRYLVVNADEGEPGTFKDRYYLQRQPHQCLEGMLIAAACIAAETVYIYLRDEYPALHQVLTQAIAELETEGWIAPGYIQLRRGAGAYICGEESALIESLEGKPGKPRQRPPYVAQRGLFQRPTLVNNLETLYWVAELLRPGSEAFAQAGRHGRQGLRSFSVSGRVARPGVHLAPAGITLRELLDEYCGGMLPGHQLLAYLPGGASGGILGAEHADLPLDFDTLQAYGCFIGSAAIIVLSDQDDLRDVLLNLMAFFTEESCGQCTPCRLGTEQLLAHLRQDRWDSDWLLNLSQVMQDASICGLGQAAPNGLLSVLKFLPHALPERIQLLEVEHG